MWQRFSERARRVVFFAQEEAGRCGENCVSTEHLLLGLVRQEDFVAARMLNIMGISLALVRTEIERQIPRGDGRLGKDMQLTPRSKRVVDLAYDEAQRLDGTYIGTEHLLLGLIREGEGLAGRILKKLGVSLEVARIVVADLQTASTDEALREKIAPLLKKIDDEPLDVYQPEAPSVGDFGVASASTGIVVGVAIDDVAFERLIATFEAKDTHGYKQMAEGDQTLFFVPTGTLLKLLISKSQLPDVRTSGFFIRVLSGDYEGYRGWIFKTNFVRTGSDDSQFPPEISN